MTLDLRRHYAFSPSSSCLDPKAKSKYMSVTIKINRDGTHKFKLHTKSSLSTLVVPDRQKAKLVMKTLKSVPHKIVKSGKGAGKRATLSTAQAK